MRTDPSALPPAEARPQGGSSSQARAGRWLADLERAMLEARPQEDPVRSPQGRAPAAQVSPPSAASKPVEAMDLSVLPGTSYSTLPLSPRTIR